jgi:hypothetical protein
MASLIKAHSGFCARLLHLHGAFRYEQFGMAPLRFASPCNQRLWSKSPSGVSGPNSIHSHSGIIYLDDRSVYTFYKRSADSRDR